MTDTKCVEEIKWINHHEIDKRVVAFVSKNVMAIGYGSTIIFVDLVTGEEKYHRAVGKKGDGIACIAGHTLHGVFAYAEYSTKPKIHVYSFPQFRQICKLSSKTIGRCICLSFSETEHLVSLTGIPNYAIEIWNWRSGKLLTVQKTGLFTDMQIIRCSRSFPLVVTQLALYMPKVIFWEVFIAVDAASLIKREIKFPSEERYNPFNFTYALDGSIYLINSIGTVYQIYPLTQKITEIIKCDNDSIEMVKELDSTATSFVEKETEEIDLKYDEKIKSVAANLDVAIDVDSKVIHSVDSFQKNDSGFLTHISCYKSGLVIVTPSGVTKVSNEWKEIWKIVEKNNFLITLCYGLELYIGVTENGLLKILKHIEDKPIYETFKVYDRDIRLSTILYPLGQYLITINGFNELKVVKISTGIRVTTTTAPKATCIKAHPNLPIVAVGNVHGTVQLFSIYVPTEVKILTEFCLTHDVIADLEYTQTGNVLVVRDEEYNIFVIQGKIGEKMEIIKHIPVKHSILTLNTVEIGGTVEINILTRKNKIEIFSDHFLQIQINSITHMIQKNLPKLYVSWNLLNKEQNNIFLVIPYKSYNYEIVQIKQGANEELVLTILRTLVTNHKFSYFEVAIYDTFFITWGLDGLVYVYKKETFEVLMSYISHNRYLGGVFKAMSGPFRRYFMSIGHNKTILCVKLQDNADTAALYRSLKSGLESEQVKSMFSSKTVGFVPSGKDAGKTWLEIMSDIKKEEESHFYAAERKKIFADLADLKANLRNLIDQNELAADDEKLPLKEFNLDTFGVFALMESARIDRSNEENRINAECIEYTKMAQMIREKTWDLMDVKTRHLRGIFTKLEVENYALHNDKTREIELEKVKVWRTAEMLVSKDDIFEPWKPKTFDELQIILSRTPGFMTEDVSEKNSTLSNGIVDTLKNDAISLSGTTSHQFINTLPIRYNQLEVVTYKQMQMENFMGYRDILELRKYFNNKFDGMIQIKDNEMVLTQQRNDRLRHIQDELNKLAELKGSDVKYDRIIIDPEYSPDEIPESIVKVEANELSITPYISPSQQALLDESAAEAERRRLAMLADDFKERALMKMMDGVLEIRWEDEIKKTPPPPDCVTSDKDPKDYTPEELKEIFDYEQTIIELQNQREKYREMLEDEQAKTDQIMEEQIQKFNMKVGHTLLEKVKVEFGICCEDLKLLRNEMFNFKRMQFSKKEKRLLIQIKEIRNEIDHLTQTLNEFEDILLACKNKYDELSTKDRLLEKQFKLSFSEYAAQAVVDQAYRVFRRRPKWQMRAWQTACILSDMAKRVNSADKSVTGPPIPEECFTYLNLIDQVEKFSNAPNLMDQHLWQILCKMRRVKIEIEFRVRSCGAQVAESEATVNAFAKEINIKKAKLLQYDKQLCDIKEERYKHIINRTVQICMKRGLIEIPLTGRMSDFDNSILLHMSDVRDINQIIKAAGLKKLKTMENAAVFRRKIIFKEWEHKVLCTKIEEKQVIINSIEKFKITKEVQMWLKWKQKGWKQDISQTALDREIEASVRSLENMCHEIDRNIKNVDDQIKVKKRTNQILDKQIQNLNIAVAEKNFSRDEFFEKSENKRQKERMKMLVERSRLTREVQQQHAHILELSTMLELQRLRTYPTLNVAAINKNEEI